MINQKEMKGFNPKEHLISIPRWDERAKKVVYQDYLEAKWRLVWFKEEHPDWLILTEIKLFPEVGMPQSSLVKATIKDEKGEIKSIEWGYAEKVVDEIDKKTGEKKTTINNKFVEKSVTTAIARALALLGYGTQWAVELEEERIEGDEEGVKVEELADSPVSIAQATLDEREDEQGNNGNGRGVITEKQAKYVRYLISKIGMTKEQYKELLNAKWGVESSKDLTYSQVSEFIDYLKGLAGEGEAQK